MRRFAPLLVVLVVGGCGVDMLDPDGSTPTPAPSPLPSGVAQIHPSETALAGGRYSDRSFEPRVTFEVEPDTWYSVQRERGFFDIQQGIEDNAHVIAVQFARPTAIFGAEGAKEPSDAANAAEILGTNPDIDVVETDTSQIGGLDGTLITFENTAEDPAEFMRLPPGTIGINQGRRIWVAFFDTDAGVLAIMVGGSIERWDDALAAAAPVLDSITIGGVEASSG